ncbi:MAG: TetR-like C-terminal domain-containing protein [Caldilineaceae bacterium]|nr:WHG domain-containing protein [Caldilineaceae bacterium]
MIKRRTLNKEAVVRRAVEMVNGSSSPEKLSLAELAASLGIRTPSLYNHISGLDGLHRELQLYTWQHLGQAMREAAAGKTGHKALFELAYAYRAFAQANPGLYRLVLVSSIEGEDAEVQAAGGDILTTIMLAVNSLGIAEEDAIHIVRGFRSLIHGFVSLESTRGFAMPYEIEKSFHRAVTAYVDGALASVTNQ